MSVPSTTNMSMTLSTMEMSMPSSNMMRSMTSTSTAATSTSSAMAGMDMGMSMGGQCKISMLWNWYTVDACFLSNTWRITSSGMFAGSCIGVISLVVSLEFLRRAQREYDAYIRRDTRQYFTAGSGSLNGALLPEDESNDSGKHINIKNHEMPPRGGHGLLARSRNNGARIMHQVVRSGLHMVQFAVAYFIMLLAMYYNGYIIICIIIGAFLGSFIFSWDQMDFSDRAQVADVTGCCG